MEEYDFDYERTIAFQLMALQSALEGLGLSVSIVSTTTTPNPDGSYTQHKDYDKESDILIDPTPNQHGNYRIELISPLTEARQAQVIEVINDLIHEDDIV